MKSKLIEHQKWFPTFKQIITVHSNSTQVKKKASNLVVYYGTIVNNFFCQST